MGETHNKSIFCHFCDHPKPGVNRSKYPFDGLKIPKNWPKTPKNDQNETLGAVKIAENDNKSIFCHFCDPLKSGVEGAEDSFDGLKIAKIAPKRQKRDTRGLKDKGKGCSIHFFTIINLLNQKTTTKIVFSGYYY